MKGFSLRNLRYMRSFAEAGWTDRFCKHRLQHWRTTKAEKRIYQADVFRIMSIISMTSCNALRLIETVPSREQASRKPLGKVL